MAYTKYNDPWVDAFAATGGGDESTPLIAAALDHIEQGVFDAAATADAAIPKAISGVATDKVPVYNGSAWVAQKIVNAQIDAAAAIDQTKLASPPMCKAVRSTALSTVHNTWALLTLDGENFDTDGIHSTSSNTNRLTCQTAGKYAVTVFLQWRSNVTGQRDAIIQKNSESLPATAETGAWIAGIELAAPSSGIALMTVSAFVSLAVNDYVTVTVHQNSGGALSLGTDTYVAMWRIG